MSLVQVVKLLEVVLRVSTAKAITEDCVVALKQLDFETEVVATISFGSEAQLV